VTLRAVAIGLKIPDNEAYTALVTLRRLGVDVARVERSEIVRLEDCGDPAALEARVKADEAIFNPNKHRLTMLGSDAPRPGEVWIETLGAVPPRCRAWRLFDETGAPVARRTLAEAVERLLCNPAIERAIFGV
jgi:phosphoribosylformylglycinamidine (FGAM) synthase PurS component